MQMVVIAFNDTFYFWIWARFFGSCKGVNKTVSQLSALKNSVTKKKKRMSAFLWLVSTFHILRSSSLTDY